MKISQTLKSLDNAWERNVILLKIKNGFSTDEIVNKFLQDNEEQVKELSSLLKQEDIDLLNQVERLSTCEAKLLNKINNLNYLKNNVKNYTIKEKNFLIPQKSSSNKISFFMTKWSNKFVVIALLTISAIALTKQAWA